MCLCVCICLVKLGPLPRILREMSAALANPGGVANQGASVSSPLPHHVGPSRSPPRLSPPLSPPLAACNPSVGLQGDIDGGLALLVLAGRPLRCFSRRLALFCVQGGGFHQTSISNSREQRPVFCHKRLQLAAGIRLTFLLSDLH